MIWSTVGASSLQDLLENWEAYKALSLECSPLTHLSTDDPPVYLIYEEDTPGPPEKEGIHHVEFGRILQEAAGPLNLSPTIEFYDKATRQAAIDQFIRALIAKE